MVEVSSIYTIIKSPLITEKATNIAIHRKYVFRVDKNANTIEIKKAIEKIYNVKVAKVNSMTVKGKMKRIRSNQAGRTSSWKKAIVTLKEGFVIKLT